MAADGHLGKRATAALPVWQKAKSDGIHHGTDHDPADCD